MSEVSYHGWTHRPKAQGGTDPIPGAAVAGMPWIRAKLYSRSVANLTWKYIPFRFLDYDPALVTEDIDYSWDEVSDGLTHKIWQITTVKEGWYFYDLQARVEQPGTAATDDGAVLMRLVDTGTDELATIRTAMDWFKQTTFGSGHDGEIPQANGVIRLSGIVYVATQNKTWKPQVQHTVGGSRAIEGSYFTIVRLMETDGTAWTELTTT